MPLYTSTRGLLLYREQGSPLQEVFQFVEEGEGLAGCE